MRACGRRVGLILTVNVSIWTKDLGSTVSLFFTPFRALSSASALFVPHLFPPFKDHVSVRVPCVAFIVTALILSIQCLGFNATASDPEYFISTEI